MLIVTEVIAGMGHLKAAEALEKTFKSNYSNSEVKIECTLSIFNKKVERLISSIYYNMIHYTPKLWGHIHQKEAKKSYVFKKLISYFLIPKLDKYVEHEKPELVIVTHACGLGALSMLKKKYNFSLVAVFTDYQLNYYWVNNNIDYYFVPHKEIKNQLSLQYNVNPDSIFDTGIPIDSIFSQETRKIEKEIYLADIKEYKILIMGGGVGIGNIKEMILLLNNIKTIPIILTVITGANEQLYQDLIKIKLKCNITIDIYKYSNNIYNLMKINDLLISKPGGLTISEAISIPLPIIIYNPIPGQEVENARFLIKMKSAIRVNEIEKIPYWIRYLYDNPKFSNRLKENQTKIAKPNSTSDIMKILHHDIYNTSSQKKDSFNDII